MKTTSIQFIVWTTYVVLSFPSTTLGQLHFPSEQPLYDDAAALCKWIQETDKPSQSLACRNPDQMVSGEMRDEIAKLLSAAGPGAEQRFTTWQIRKAQQARKDREDALINRARFAEQARRKEFDSRVHTASVQVLCDETRKNGSPVAMNELASRKAFGPKELDLIRNNQIAIHMSEAALLCAWGITKSKRFVSANGVQMEYQFNNGTVVHVSNGKVVAYAD